MRGISGKVWRRWPDINTTFYPAVWVDSREEWEQRPRNKARMLQHEWVHLKDAESFFGLLPRSLKYLNVGLFYAAYAMPQLLAVLALLAPAAVVLGAPPDHWWLALFILLLLPFPAYGRMKAEVRAYRRTIELGGDPERVVEHFVGSSYWYMWPFRKYVLKELVKPSPYKAEMNEVWFEV